MSEAGGGMSAVDLLVRMQSAEDDGGGGATPVSSEGGNVFDLLTVTMDGPGTMKIEGVGGLNMDFSSAFDLKSLFDSPLFKILFGNFSTQSLFPTIDYFANVRNILMTNPLNAPVPGILKSQQGMAH